MKKLKKMTFANIDKMLEANQIQALPELQSIVGGGSGTSSDPFTMDEFEEMSFAHTWAGGFVSGMGYVTPDVFCFGSPTYPGEVTQTDYTLGEYAQQLKEGTWEYIVTEMVSTALSKFPLVDGAKSVYGILENEYKSMVVDFITELSAQGYCGDQLFTMVRTRISEYLYKYTAYDTTSGDALYSQKQYLGFNTKYDK